MSIALNHASVGMNPPMGRKKLHNQQRPHYLSSPPVVLRLPYPCTQWFADAKAHAHCYTDDEKPDGQLDHDPSPLAESSHAAARSILPFGGESLLPPVGLTGPHATIRVEPISTHVRLSELFRRLRLLHSLHIGIESSACGCRNRRRRCRVSIGHKAPIHVSLRGRGIVRFQAEWFRRYSDLWLLGRPSFN